MIRFVPLWCALVACAEQAPTAPAAPNALDAGVAADSGSMPSDSGVAAADAGTQTDARVEPRDTGTSAPQGDRPLRPGIQEITIEQMVEGERVRRLVLIQAPTRLDEERRYPVVFAFHGNGGRPQGFVGQLRRFVDDGRFIAILPEGLERSWNLGREASQADDVAFVALIMAVLRDYRQLDLSRAFAYGFSNGSGLVNQLAAHTDFFSGYAMGASALTEDLLPPERVHIGSFLSLHGTNDNVCPYEGGRGAGGHVFLPVEESVGIWADKIGCPDTPQRRRTEDGNLRLEFGPCPGGHRVIHYGIEGAGHRLPNDQEDGLMDLIITFFEQTP